jgi:MoaA/NifB/PqqE/SkfB family radical SAM enzyme
MQYYEEPKNISFEEIVKDFDDLTSKVSHIFEIRLIGGEPFMNKDIYKILEYLFSKSNFSKVVVYSNAMIPIKEENVKILKDKRLVFSMTNYGNLAKNTPKVVEQLDRLGIAYRLHEPENWTDSGVIHDFKRSQNGLEKIFEDCCGKNLLTLSMGKIYRCPFAANADRLNAIPPNELNYVSVENSSEMIKKYTREIKYLPACNYCKGRSFDSPSIEPAIQAERPLSYIKFQ